MTAITRRQAISQSGLALAAIGAVPESFAQAAPTTSNTMTPTSSSVTFNMDLGNYAADHLARVLAKAHARTATQSDYLSLSSSMTLLASHVDESGLDSALRQWANAPNTADIASSQSVPAFSEDSFARVQKYAPTLTREALASGSCCMVPGATMSSDQLRKGVEAIAAHGLSYHFRASADMFLLHASTAPLATNVSLAHSAGSLKYQVYSKETPAHFVGAKMCAKNIPFTPQQIIDLCALKAGLYGGLSTVGMAWFCTILTGTVVLAWMGAACWAATLILAVCTVLIAYYCTLS